MFTDNVWQWLRQCWPVHVWGMVEIDLHQEEWPGGVHGRVQSGADGENHEGNPTDRGDRGLRVGVRGTRQSDGDGEDIQNMISLGFNFYILLTVDLFFIKNNCLKVSNFKTIRIWNITKESLTSGLLFNLNHIYIINSFSLKNQLCSFTDHIPVIIVHLL